MLWRMPSRNGWGREWIRLNIIMHEHTAISNVFCFRKIFDRSTRRQSWEQNVAGSGPVLCSVTRWTVRYHTQRVGCLKHSDVHTQPVNCNVINFNSSSIMASYKDDTHRRTQQNKERKKQTNKQTNKKQDIESQYSKKWEYERRHQNQDQKEWNRNKE
jgi:hypothetical protein